MTKKIVAATLLMSFIGILIVGAVNRTAAKTADRARVESTSQLAANHGNANQTDSSAGRGWGRQEEALETAPTYSGRGRSRDASVDSERVQGQGRFGQGQNNQSPRAGADNQASSLAEHEEMDWQTYTGVVSEKTADGLTISVEEGTEILIEGRAWQYLLDAGFEVEPGDMVNCSGFEEDGEFKIGSLSQFDAAEGITIREFSGRPLWAGQGRGRSQ